MPQRYVCPVYYRWYTGEVKSQIILPEETLEMLCKMCVYTFVVEKNWKYILYRIPGHQGNMSCISHVIVKTGKG